MRGCLGASWCIYAFFFNCCIFWWWSCCWWWHLAWEVDAFARKMLMFLMEIVLFVFCQTFRRWSPTIPTLRRRSGGPASLTCPPTLPMNETIPGNARLNILFSLVFFFYKTDHPSRSSVYYLLIWNRKERRPEVIFDLSVFQSLFPSWVLSGNCGSLCGLVHL